MVASGSLGQGAKAAKDTVKDKVEDVQEAWETSQVKLLSVAVPSGLIMCTGIVDCWLRVSFGALFVSVAQIGASPGAFCFVGVHWGIRRVGSRGPQCPMSTRTPLSRCHNIIFVVASSLCRNYSHRGIAKSASCRTRALPFLTDCVCCCKYATFCALAVPRPVVPGGQRAQPPSLLGALYDRDRYTFNCAIY